MLDKIARQRVCRNGLNQDWLMRLVNDDEQAVDLLPLNRRQIGLAVVVRPFENQAGQRVPVARRQRRGKARICRVAIVHTDIIRS